MKRPSYRFITRKPAQKDEKSIVNVRDAVAVWIVLCEHDNSARIEIQAPHCANLKKCVTLRVAKQVRIIQSITAYIRASITAAKSSLNKFNIVEVVELV